MEQRELGELAHVRIPKSRSYGKHGNSYCFGRVSKINKTTDEVTVQFADGFITLRIPKRFKEVE